MKIGSISRNPSLISWAKSGGRGRKNHKGNNGSGSGQGNMNYADSGEADEDSLFDADMTEDTDEFSSMRHIKLQMSCGRGKSITDRRFWCEKEFSYDRGIVDNWNIDQCVKN